VRDGRIIRDHPVIDRQDAAADLRAMAPIDPAVGEPPAEPPADAEAETEAR
jgi:hypothetical protein